MPLAEAHRFDRRHNPHRVRREHHPRTDSAWAISAFRSGSVPAPIAATLIDDWLGGLCRCAAPLTVTPGTNVCAKPRRMYAFYHVRLSEGPTMTSIRPVSSISCFICPANVGSLLKSTLENRPADQAPIRNVGAAHRLRFLTNCEPLFGL